MLRVVAHRRAGRPAGPCPASGCPTRLAFISRPTGSFTPWAVAPADTAGSEFTHPFEYDPNTNTWTTKAATYPDNHGEQHGLRRAHRRRNALHLLRGRLASPPRRSRPIASSATILLTDTISPVAAPWPAARDNCSARWLHRVFNNKLYILGGFDTVTGGGQGINQIWEFTPSPAAWVQKPTVLPVPLGYIPTTTIGSLIYTGGGSDITAGALTDTTNSFVYNPVANTIGTIAAIPRATGETRALNFNGKMLVMGGGRTAPNPSNEVDAYDPVANSWAVNSPVPAFANARRNFPTDTDGTTRIWLAGGYDSTGITNRRRRNGSAREVERQRQHRRQRLRQLLQQQQQQQQRQQQRPQLRLLQQQRQHGDGHRHSIPNGDTATRNSSYANTAASADTSASSIAPVAASLPATPKLREGGCEAQGWDDCKCG